MSKISHAENTTEQPTPRIDNEKELTSMVMNMETKHGKVLI